MTEVCNSSVGVRLLELRNEKKMTQEDLAEYLNVSRQSVSKWELDKTLPDVEKLVQLSVLYEVSLDYLVKGEREVAEELESVAEKTLSEYISEQAVLKKINEKVLYRTVFLIAMIACCIMCLCTFVFGFRILADHVPSGDGKEQDVTYVDNIYEQYTLANVIVWDKDMNYHNEKVWLDITGVREGDYVGYYYDKSDSDKIYFQYYGKTIIVPFIVSILLLIFTIVFGLGFYSYGGKRSHEEK